MSVSDEVIPISPLQRIRRWEIPDCIHWLLGILARSASLEEVVARVHALGIEGRPLESWLLSLDIEITEALLEAGACIAYNDAALLRPAREGDLDMLVFLTSRGLDIHAWNEGVLRWGAEWGQDAVVIFALDMGANIHAMNDYALKWAIAARHVSTVRLLISRGANIDAEARQWAAESGQVEIQALVGI